MVPRENIRCYYSIKNKFKTAQKLTLFCKISLDNEFEIDCNIVDTAVKSASARIVTGEVHNFNDFGAAEKINAQDHNVEAADGRITVKVPPCSVIAVEVIPE